MTAYAYKGEAQFLAWGDGPQGPWIKLKLPDSDDLAPFRGMTGAKATQAGQILALGIVEVNADQPSLETDAAITEAATEAVKGGALAKLSGILCADPRFQEWMKSSHYWKSATEMGCTPEEAAAEVIRKSCGVTSRAQLDHDETAAAIFHQEFRRPWLRYCQGEAGNRA